MAATLPADRHPEQSVRSQVGHLDAIEALRAVAIGWVVLFHYFVARDAAARDPWNAWIEAHRPAKVLAANGYLGVDLFFLITGFLLVLPWVRHRRQGGEPPSVRDFYVRRLRRIVPAYYVQLALLFAVFVPLLRGWGEWREDPGFLALNAAAHAAFLHYTTPLTSASLSINGALWTLSLEAQFYLLLPLLAPLFVARPLATAAAMALAAAAWRWLSLHGLEPLVAWQMAIGARWDVPEAAIRHLLLTQLPGYLAHFAAGMALACAWWPRARREPGPAAGALALAGVAAALLSLYAAYGLGGGARLGPYGSWLLTVAALAGTLAAFVLGGRLASAVLVNRATLFVGRTSYSAYLYHLPVLLAWNRFRVLDGSWLSLPAYVATVLVVAALSWRFVERPFLQRPPIIGG